MRPEQFILTGDYATVANDDNATFTITVPGSVVLAPGASMQWTETKQVGVQGGFDILQIEYTGSNGRLAGPITILERTGTAIYNVRFQVSRTSPTEITAFAEIFNGSGSTLTTNSSPITATFYVSTFIPPFS